MGHYAEILIDLIPTNKGGRSSAIQIDAKKPDRYCPQLRASDGQCVVVEFFYGDVDVLHPGESSRIGISLNEDPNARDALQLNTRFEVLEGDTVIGTGRVVGLYGTDDDVWKQLAEEQKRRRGEK